jgi:NitT/TauT family transport system permease protein
MRRLLRVLVFPLVWGVKEVVLPLFWDLPEALFNAAIAWFRERYVIPAVSGYRQIEEQARWVGAIVPTVLGIALGLAAGKLLLHWLSPPWPAIVRELPMAILQSTARLVVALAISLAVTVPLVLWCWDRPRLRQTLTTVAQIGASLPAVALFPLLVLVTIRKFGGGMEIASIVLVLTGMLWYPLFNCLGGVSTIPADLTEAMKGLGLARIGLWKKLVIPAMRPALVTGAITAWGGGWNALVVSEYVRYKDQTFEVTGIGSLLARSVYEMGDNQAITFCIAGMVGWILLINAFVWKPVYRSTVDRYKFEA